MKINRDGTGIFSKNRFNKIQIKITHPINNKGSFK